MLEAKARKVEDSSGPRILCVIENLFDQMLLDIGVNVYRIWSEEVPSRIDGDELSERKFKRHIWRRHHKMCKVNNIWNGWRILILYRI